MMTKIILADDDAGLRRVMHFKLEKNGYEVTSVADGRAALSEIRKTGFDLLISDMKMPGLNGMELLKAVKSLKPETEVILITAFAEVPLAVQAIKAGAFDYITKPFEDEELFVAIDKALRFRDLRQENRRLRRRLAEQAAVVHIAGVSRQYREMMALIDKVAPTDATVLVTGESGTGKEMVARDIHARSQRAEGPFVALNCAAIPRELLESELFGHVKGAFTGAVRDKKGKFELADGGTLLLDEISELNLELQAKLLRVIQEKVIEPVGSEKQITVDIRVVAATNRDLRTAVANGRFREDLYYRLNVIPINVPPLRERRDDIVILTKAFLKKYSPDQELTVDAALMETLKDHAWPGNVRQLENLVERMVILRRSDHLTVEDLPEDFDSEPVESASRPAGRVTFDQAEKNLVLDALNKCDWNKSKAAAYLQIPRHVLVYRMKKHAIANRRPTAN